MKKRGFILTALIGLVTVFSVASCSGGAHLCDAYGSIEVAPIKQFNDEQVPNLHSLTPTEVGAISPKS